MNNKKKTLILIGLFVILIVGSSVLYNNLSTNFQMDSLAVEEGAKETNTADTAAANNSQSAENATSTSEDTTSSDNTTNKSEDTASSDNTENKLTKAPNFTVYDLDGNEVNLSDFFGKPIIVNFWASWCGPCKMEMPDFNEAYQLLNEDITFLMVNMTDGSRETVDIASSFIEKSGYTFPVYYDTSFSAAITYSVSSLPTTYFIDADGNLIAHARGAIDAATLQKGIDMIK